MNSQKAHNQTGERVIKAVKQNMMPSVLSVAVWVAMGQAHAMPATNTLPSGENVAVGTATFNRSIANRLIVNQNSDRLITNWNSFDVGSDARVSFKQPSSSSIALNRVTSGSPTEIFGAINANGQIFIVNPNGILFGAGSQVRAAGIVASTLDVMSDEDFKVKPYTQLWIQSNRGVIENQGILISSNGSIALVATKVKNSGRIKATGGNAILADTNSAVFYASQDPSIENSTSIGFIQNSGILQATAFENRGGKVLLKAAKQNQSKVELSGRVLSTDGLEVTGEEIYVNRLSSDNNSYFNASKIDFTDIFDLEGKDSQLNLYGEYSSPVNYSFLEGAKINFKGTNSSLIINGSDFSLIRNINDLILFNKMGSFSWKYALAADIDASEISSLPGSPEFQPKGSIMNPFEGTFDGLGHSIRNLRIEQPHGYSAFFGYTRDATISNLNLINVNMRGFAAAGLVYHSAGGLISNNQVTGNITANISDYHYSYVYPDYFDPYYFYNNNISMAAGLIGISYSGPVLNNRVNVKVSSKGHADSNWIIPTGALGQAGLAGGLIAINDPSSTVISNTVAGTVTGQYKVGGLIGENTGAAFNNISSADVVLTKPLNPANPYGLAGPLASNDMNGHNNVSTGTVTIK